MITYIIFFFYRYLIEMWWRNLNKSDTFNAFLRDLIETF